MNNRKDGQGFMFGFILGSLIGASVAIVLAPHSGERTREIIRDHAADFKLRASDLAAEYREKMADLAAEYREEVGDYYERGKERLRKATTCVGDQLSSLSDNINPDISNSMQ